MDVKQILDNKSEYRDKLFARGFLFTDAEVDTEAYPFYGLWKNGKVGRFNLLVSPKQHFYTEALNGVELVLIGHAYNPVDRLSDENVILQKILQCFINGNKSEYWNRVNQLTGIFTLLMVKDEKVYIIGDPTCMQTTFFTVNEGRVYISTHTAMLGDLLGLPVDAYVKRLINYRFFRLLGNSLPGDLTPYTNVKRVVPNHYVCISENLEIKAKRFYTPHKLNLSPNEVEDQVAELLHENMVLITEKWKKPAISMTGGCDSKTTLACANGTYDKYNYFSYQSSESEQVDAEAAKKIAEALNLKHTTYTIPDSDDEIKGIEIIRAILDHNSGDIIPHNRNDVRKRAFFADTEDFDVEVKSWASEIGRSYYSKRFNGRKNFGKTPSPRKCTTMYKFFLHDRKLVRDTDQVFKQYLDKYFKADSENPVEWQEQLFWEFRVPSWNGLVITGEHRYSFDITIPYNNRLLLNLLLSVPIDERISDRAYADIRKKMNPLIDETGIAVQNLKHTKRREKLENIYYVFNNTMI